MAMPWSRGKQIRRALLGEDEFPSGYKGSRTKAQLTALFDACFRIQREAIEAAGHFIPLVVENVKGAQDWVGRSHWNYGSFHLYGDVPALMPMTKACAKVPGLDWNGSDKPGYVAQAFNTTAEQRLREGQKVPGFRFDGSGKSFQTASVDTFGWSKESQVRNNSSHSHARKAASAAIAKIPLPLAQHIARYWRQQVAA